MGRNPATEQTQLRDDRNGLGSRRILTLLPIKGSFTYERGHNN
jgi:hypothetical protein